MLQKIKWGTERGERGQLEGDEEAGLVAVWGENPHMQREQIGMQRPWGRRLLPHPRVRNEKWIRVTHEEGERKAELIRR